MSKVYGIVLALVLPFTVMTMERQDPPNNLNFQHVSKTKKKNWSISLNPGKLFGGGAVVVFGLICFVAAPVGVILAAPVATGVVSGSIMGFGLGGMLTSVESVHPDVEHLEPLANDNGTIVLPIQEDTHEPNHNHIEPSQELAINHRVISFQDLEKEYQESQNRIRQSKKPQIEYLELDVPLIVFPHSRHAQNLGEVATYEELVKFKHMDAIQQGNFICYSRRFQKLCEESRQGMIEMWRDKQKKEKIQQNESKKLRKERPLEWIKKKVETQISSIKNKREEKQRKQSQIHHATIQDKYLSKEENK